MTYDQPPGWDPQSQPFDKPPQDYNPQQPQGYGYEQPGYNPGYPQQPGYPQPAPGYYPQGYQGYYGAPPPDHPQAVVILILGIMSLVFCQLIGPVAWVMGSRARREIRDSGGAIGGGGMVTAGWVCGIVASCLTIAAILFFVLLAVIGAFASN